MQIPSQSTIDTAMIQCATVINRVHERCQGVPTVLLKARAVKRFVEFIEARKRETLNHMNLRKRKR